MSDQSSDNLHINGRWVRGEGELFASRSPIDDSLLGLCQETSEKQLFEALEGAKKAQTSWCLEPYEVRCALLRRCHGVMAERFELLSKLISQETGKPLWESKKEVEASLAKFDASLEGYQERCREKRFALGDAIVATEHRPLGVVGVLGPFNFPLHLPQGHIVPALLAGNAVVFKPSEKTPFVGEALARLWEQAGCPEGLLQLIQGGKRVGKLLSEQKLLDGLFFTGSWQTGSSLMRQSADYPHRLLALEMGGNNPLVIWGSSDDRASVSQIIFSAFITAGQRCSCARRLILPWGEESDALVAKLIEACKRLRLQSDPKDPSIEPFMGPLIDKEAAEALWAKCEGLLQRGAKPLLVPKERLEQSAYLPPIVLDVTALEDRGGDEELFGPILKVIRVDSFDDAIEECNRTEYGLCASLLSDDEGLWHRFQKGVRAGIINWNNPTTGASGKAPFGGLGRSGNFRPGGYYAADYCSYPIASTKNSKLVAQVLPGYVDV